MVYSLSEKRAYMGVKHCGLQGSLLQLLKTKSVRELSWVPCEQQYQCCFAMTAKIIRFLLTYSQTFVKFVELLDTMLCAVLKAVYLFEKHKPTTEQMKGESNWKWVKFYAECLNVASSCYCYEMLTSLLNLFYQIHDFIPEDDFKPMPVLVGRK